MLAAGRPSMSSWGMRSEAVSDQHPAPQFCADVPPGNARAKECLEDSREQPGFSATCKTEVEKMMESRASDFRLDPKLRQLCADDIQVGTCSLFCPVLQVGQSLHCSFQIGHHPRVALLLCQQYH